MFRSSRLGVRLLGFPIVLGGTLIAVMACAWLAPVVVALAHGGSRAVSEIQTRDRVFPGAAKWMSPMTADVLGGLGMLGGFSGLILGAMLSIRCWRVLVVRKLQWMTVEEFEGMLESFGDF
jgi:hypothetical protein